jgi:predicted GIY-YIG superfamily endonuclease
MAHQVYLLQSQTAPNQTYVGYTNNLEKRIKQHNGELAGGALSTKRYRPWVIIAYATFKTSKEALSVEYQIKHSRKLSGIKLLKDDILTRRLALLMSQILQHTARTGELVRIDTPGVLLEEVLDIPPMAQIDVYKPTTPL